MHRLLAAICFSSCQFAAAQSTTLPIGPLTLSLGSDQATVMKQVDASFYVVAVTGQANTFFLSESRPPHVNVIGAVAFKEGRLSWIQRSWGSFEGKTNATEIAKALFSAIESATVSSGEGASITSEAQRVPGIEFKTINFAFPGRKVTVTSSEADATHGGLQVNITESVRASPR